MSTTFKVTCTQTNGSQWDVDLGVNITDGLTPQQKQDYAEAHAVVVLQNNPKYALRHAEDDDQILAVLKPDYPNATCKPHVKAEPKVKMTTEQALAKILGIPLEKVTPELVAKAKALVQ